MQPAPHASATVTNDGLVVLDLRSGRIFTANDVGARIWSLAVDGHDEKGIVTALARDYAVGSEDLSNDVREFLECLKAKELMLIP